MSPLWAVLLYLLQFLWMITYSLIYLSMVVWQWNAHESSYTQRKWQCCNGCIILTQWKSSNFMTNKFRLRVYEREMESKSDVVRTKTGERLNLLKVQITFSFSVSPSFFIVWMNAKERNVFRDFFYTIPSPPNLTWGNYFNSLYVSAFNLNIHICKQGFCFYRMLYLSLPINTRVSFQNQLTSLQCISSIFMSFSSVFMFPVFR